MIFQQTLLSIRIPGGFSRVKTVHQLRIPSKNTDTMTLAIGDFVFTALTHARQAVDLDNKFDTSGAITEYAQAVFLLGSVIENMLQRQSSPEVEHYESEGEELRRLQTICDTYRVRMELLTSRYRGVTPVKAGPFSNASTGKSRL